ncbi:MAG: hypothetical protein WA782_01150 [Sulfitobacter sp.]
MLITSAFLLIVVGLMHSLLGGKRLIAPLLRRADVPVFLGSIENTRLTLWVGWHLLTLMFFGQAALLLVITLSPEDATTAALITVSFTTGLAGMLALVLTGGKHCSWLMFLPISVLTGVAANWMN